MAKRTRRNHSPAFKAKVALEAVREQESVAEIARRYGLHGNVVANWKRQLAENVQRVFETGGDHDGAERESELLKKLFTDLKDIVKITTSTKTPRGQM